MIRDYGITILRGIFLLLLQGLVLNNLPLGTYFQPYLYVMFIILLPFETPNWMILPLSFFYGLILDSFTNTYGLHASACTFLAWNRPQFLRLFAPRDGYDAATLPGIQAYGFNWFISYAGTLILMHHIVFFLLEAFRFEGIGHTLLRCLGSASFTLFLAIIAQYLFLRPQTR
ncbi:MAG: rod shape-determining protein MreD [Flavobacteriales bacterium]